MSGISLDFIGQLSLLPTWINSLWPSDAVWRQRSGSTLAQVMACCRTAPNHYLNQCWLIINEVQRHSPRRNFMRYVPNINRWNELENHLTKTLLKSPRGQWVNFIPAMVRCTEADNATRGNTVLIMMEDHLKTRRSLWNSKMWTLQWRHNERDVISNDRRLNCLLNRLFKSKKKHQRSAARAFVMIPLIKGQ